MVTTQKISAAAPIIALRLIISQVFEAKLKYPVFKYSELKTRMREPNNKPGQYKD